MERQPWSMEHRAEVPAELPRIRHRPAVVVPVLAGLALVGGQLPSFSTPANLWVLLTGGAVLCWGLASRSERRPAPARLGREAWWWAVPVLVFIFFEASTFGLGSRDDYPTFSHLADPPLEHELIRTVAYFGWLSAFWALARR
jgi:hypothetical protein